MYIETTDNKKTVDDYDILFDNGAVMPLRVDRALGDTFEFPEGAKVIVAHLTAKPSQNDPDHMLPAEDIHIFTSKIVSIQHRVTEVIQLSQDQKSEWQKTFKEMNKTVQ